MSEIERESVCVYVCGERQSVCVERERVCVCVWCKREREGGREGGRESE